MRPRCLVWDWCPCLASAGRSQYAHSAGVSVNETNIEIMMAVADEIPKL